MRTQIRRIEITGLKEDNSCVGFYHISPRPIRGIYLTIRKAKKRLKADGAVTVIKEKIWEDVYV